MSGVLDIGVHGGGVESASALTGVDVLTGNPRKSGFGDVGGGIKLDAVVFLLGGVSGVAEDVLMLGAARIASMVCCPVWMSCICCKMRLLESICRW